MPLQLGPVPNFQTNIQQTDPLQTYSKLLQLKALMGQQQLLPGQLQMQQQQVQSQTLANQKAQQEMDSEKDRIKVGDRLQVDARRDVSVR